LANPIQQFRSLFAPGANDLSRRDFTGLIGTALLSTLSTRSASAAVAKSFRIRTITAGVPLAGAADLDRMDPVLSFLAAAAPDWAAAATTEAILALDRLAAEHDLAFSVGPVITTDEHDERFPARAAELIRKSRQVSLSVAVASKQGVYRHSARTAAEAIAAISRTAADGEGNFRFAAAALPPAGAPFFPVAWFRDAKSFSLGLESADLLRQVLAAAGDQEEAKRSLRRRLNDELAPVQQVARRIAAASGWRYLGIDVSPAPSPEASIGEAIEAFTGVPFGSPSTLAGCAAITDVLHGLDIDTCGYSGLMLPQLEDEVLSRRAAEGRYGVSDLLLYSSVCGSGLDTVPLPGDTSPKVLAGLIEDVAALAVKYQKPLAARLLPIPGKVVGDAVQIDNPHLTDGVVMDPAS
jgi:uncharacterized protein (UPF0210 family)